MASETTSTSLGDKQGRRGFGWLIAPLAVFAAMAVMFAYALSSGDPSRLPSALIGKPAPQVDFPALKDLKANGNPVPGFQASELAGGGVTVVNFWASWCGPCRDEHPILEELRKRTNVRMVGINYKDPAPGGNRFLAQYGNPYHAVGVDAVGRGAIDWGVYGMPETFIIDGKGRVAYKHVGPMNLRALNEKVLPAIAAAGKGD